MAYQREGVVKDLPNNYELMFDIVQLDVVHRRASDEAQIAEHLAGNQI